MGCFAIAAAVVVGDDSITTAALAVDTDACEGPAELCSAESVEFRQLRAAQKQSAETELAVDQAASRPDVEAAEAQPSRQAIVDMVPPLEPSTYDGLEPEVFPASAVQGMPSFVQTQQWPGDGGDNCQTHSGGTCFLGFCDKSR